MCVFLSVGNYKPNCHKILALKCTVTMGKGRFTTSQLKSSCFSYIVDVTMSLVIVEFKSEQGASLSDKSVLFYCSLVG